MSEAASFLRGARNFRAVLPYKSADGRRLRENVLFRSGELSQLHEDDLSALHQLNIRLVCDLRSESERHEYVSRWPDGSRHRQLDLPDREQTNASPDHLFRLLQAEPNQNGGVAAMLRLYRRKPLAFAANLKFLFETLLAGKALPLLVHCHAGKDRTGFIVAMLLSAAGISREDVMADYTLTGRFFAPERELPQMLAWAKTTYGHDLAPAAAQPLVEARPEYLEASFTEIDQRFGSVNRYLHDAVGLSDDARRAYQDLLLV